jgi:fluoroacetyl-CoA thioesterase
MIPEPRPLFIFAREERASMPEPGEQFPVGLTGEVSITVTPEVTARHMGSGAVQVFATPEMVRLMERAAVRALADHLGPGQQSVGVVVNVKHMAASPVGATVTARARLVAVDGRRLQFEVSAHDGVDLVGEGTHERALIDMARFEDRVAKKRSALGLAA